MSGLFWLIWACASPQPPDGSAQASAQDTSADTGVLPTGQILFDTPLAEPERFSQLIGVDHDPDEYAGGIESLICLDAQGRAFPHCYDGHQGSDFILAGGFDSMDAGSTGIIAAASGVVVYAEDGHYDRCHGSLETGEVDCDGNERIANAVTLQHDTGHYSLYWHMMKGSVAVSVGDTVEVGQHLGVVGSSGKSSLPHLHFELQTPRGRRIDPYAGPHSQPETWWCAQDEPVPGPCAR